VAGLGFVPEVFLTRHRRTWVETAGRLWELTTWMPGRADFHQHPSAARLRAACAALDRLHTAWAVRPLPRLPCPAVGRRLARAAEWTLLVHTGWRPLDRCAPDDPMRPWAERAWPLLLRHAPAVAGQLAPWVGSRVLIQPCLCDPWHDHILFD